NRAQDGVAQRQRRRGLGEPGQLGRDLVGLGHLLGAVPAGGQVRLEFGQFRLVERVEGIGAGGLMNLVQESPPNVSRSFLGASRLRVFPVPSGSSSSSAIWLWVMPSK